MNIKNLTKTTSGHTETVPAVEAFPTATDKVPPHVQYPNSLLGLLDAKLSSLI